MITKNIFDDNKNVYLHDRFFESDRIFTTEHVKIVKILGFFSCFV